MTGGVHRAAAGEITVLAGGDEAVFAAHRPAARGDRRRGHPRRPARAARRSIKVITNMLAFIHLVAAGEALMLAKRGGLDLALGLRGDPRELGQLASCTRPRAS